MDETKIDLELQSGDSGELIDLLDFLKSESSGMKLELKEKNSSEHSAMGLDPATITILLASPVVAAGIKELFSVIKDFFKMRNEGKQTDAEKGRITLSSEDKDGNKKTITVNSFGEDENLFHVFRKFVNLNKI